MNKLFMTLLILAVAGCTSSNNSEVKQLKGDLRFTTDQLQTCQNQLSVYRGSGSSGGVLNQEETPSTTEENSEPQYETVTFYEVDGTRCYSTNEGDEASTGNAPRCGRSFWDCKDGVVRECMNNIKYKLKEEQKLVE